MVEGIEGKKTVEMLTALYESSTLGGRTMVTRRKGHPIPSLV